MIEHWLNHDAELSAGVDSRGTIYWCCGDCSDFQATLDIVNGLSTVNPQLQFEKNFEDSGGITVSAEIGLLITVRSFASS